MEPGQDPNYSNNPEINVNLANPGQVPNGIPTSDTISAPQPAAPLQTNASQTPPPPPPPPAEPLPPVAPPEGGSEIRWDRVAIVGVGVIILLALGTYFFLNSRKPVASTPKTTTPTSTSTTAAALDAKNLIQQTGDGTASISSGTSYNQNKVTLTFDIANATGSDVIPEVEVQPLGSSFTGTPSAKGTAAKVGTDGTTLNGSVVVTSLTDGAYHWQARAVQGSKQGNWALFGVDSTVADFAIDTVAPGIPTVSNVDSTAVAAGKTVSITSVRPTFTGKADPSSTVTVSIKPEDIKLTTTSDTTGNWTITSNVDVPTGNHDVTITSLDAAGNAAASTLALGVNTAAVAATSTASTGASTTTAATTTTTSLSKTGEDTHTITLLAMLAAIASAAALIIVNRNARRI